MTVGLFGVRELPLGDLDQLVISFHGKDGGLIYATGATSRAR